MNRSPFWLSCALVIAASCVDSALPPTSPTTQPNLSRAGSRSVTAPNGYSADTIAVGESVQLTATLNSPGHKVRTVTWTSRNTAVATVTQTGLATGVGVGITFVIASNGASSDSARLTVTDTTSPPPPPPPPPSCGVTDLNTHPTTALAKPAYLTPVTEPDFGTQLVRVSGDLGTPIGNGVAGNWPDVARHEYAKDEPWFADGRLLVLKHMQAAGGSQYHLFLDGDTYAPLFTRSGPPGGGDWRVHPTLADVAIVVTQSGTAGHWNVRTNTVTTIATLAGYSGVRLGDSEGNVSNDGRYVPVRGFRSIDGHNVVFVIDLVTGTKSGDIDVAAQGVSTLDWESVSPSGQYVVLHGTINGVSQNSKIFDRATLAVVGTWTDTPLGHWDIATDALGNDVGFGRASSGTYNNQFIARRLSDGAVTALLPNYGYFSYHASARSIARPGWGEATADPGQAPPYTGEVLWVKLDGSQAVQRLAHHRSTGSTYWAQAQGVPSPDGSRVLFASDWGVSGGPVSSYIVRCPQ